jgi:methionine-R-sulfoxide reductase
VCIAAVDTDPIISTEQTELPTQVMQALAETAVDDTYIEKEGVDVIYLAGGCFWGVEKMMQSIPGVVAAISGYANGMVEIFLTYDRVVSGDTGYRETVRVEYKPDKISLDGLIFAYYKVIDPLRWLALNRHSKMSIGIIFERGLYVDVVTGEPLFSSSDKFASDTGWPSFSKGIDENTFVFIEDEEIGMTRTEVRSRAGNSHLGHVFYNETTSPTGTRFFLNSAALRFVPLVR